MQNGNVWVLTKRSHLLWKSTLEAMKDDRNSKLMEVDEDILKRKPIKKMYVDPMGVHCFLLAEHEIFYNHWGSNRVFQVMTKPQEGQAASQQPKAFRSVDLQYQSPLDRSSFEVLLGTEDGNIFHAAFQWTPQGLNTMKHINWVFQTPDYRPILDLKIAKIAGNQVVLAITENSLHQFHSNRNQNIREIFQEY
jgi:hypothetical protein